MHNISFRKPIPRKTGKNSIYSLKIPDKILEEVNPFVIYIHAWTNTPPKSTFMLEERFKIGLIHINNYLYTGLKTNNLIKLFTY